MASGSGSWGGGGWMEGIGGSRVVHREWKW
jgi:hypothetical protein